MSRLIIIRGNSGSGKTTIAKRLQQELQPHFVSHGDRGTMLVQQDIVRRDTLRVRDYPGNPAVKLIEQMVRYGEEAGYDVILEGILSRQVYADMLMRLLTHFNERMAVYYFDISFQETVRRHATKPNAHDYGEAQMRAWYKEQDVLGLPAEKIFGDAQTEDEIFTSIMRDLA